MKISEKQINQLLFFAQQYRHLLFKLTLTKDGEHELRTINLIISEIINQQSDELRELKDECQHECDQSCVQSKSRCKCIKCGEFYR